MLLEYWGPSFFTVTTAKGTVVAFDPVSYTHLDVYKRQSHSSGKAG